jgi:hypothetical protein
MSFSQFPLVNAGAKSGAITHLHTAIEACPTCEQPIPLDRFDEIKEKIGNRQIAYASQVAERLQEQFAREKAEALEQAALAAATNLRSTVASARADERQAANTDAAAKLASAERISKAAQSALQTRIDEVEAAKSAAEQSGNSARVALEQARLDHHAEIDQVKADADANAISIRADAVKDAEAALSEKIAGMERSREESETGLRAQIEQTEAAKIAAEQSGNAIRAELEQTRTTHEAAMETLRQDAEKNAVSIRADAVKDAQTAMREKIAGLERTHQAAETASQEKIASAELARADAELKFVASEQRIQSLTAAHEANTVERLNEQRDVLEKAQANAVNAEKSASFQKELRLQEKVDQLQRALDNKTAEDLGEGAEIDLYDVLKGEFEGDKIERINKGQAGADILHTVFHNGKACGSIIYDSKNHNAWRNDFVTKLASDQMGAKADHAVLSTRKFPAGKRHLHMQDGVILAAPSRVLALVQILRQHIVQTHTLRWSNEARAQKTAALYAFINSERCRDLFNRIDSQAEKLLDLQVKEKKAHDANWKTQGEMIRSVQKVQAEILNEIDSIVGTAEALEQAIHE